MFWFMLVPYYSQEYVSGTAGELHLCIDARKAGNVARWINSSRTSQEANLVIQSAFTPMTGHGSAAFYRVLSFASTDIPPCTDLTDFYGDDYVRQCKEMIS